MLNLVRTLNLSLSTTTFNEKPPHLLLNCVKIDPLIKLRALAKRSGITSPREVVHMSDERAPKMDLAAK